MKAYVFQCVLLIAGLVLADNYGDFAPLEVGNIWVYQKFNGTHSLYGMYYNNDISKITIELVNSSIANDTLFYFFKNSAVGMIAMDTSDAMEPETTYYDYIRYDTLFEVNDSIYKKTWNYDIPLPVLEKHEIDSASMEAPYYLLITDSSIVYRYFFGTGLGIETERTYQADIGFVSYKNNNSPHGSGSNSTCNLLSFSRNGEIVSTSLQPQNEVTQTYNKIIRPQKLLILPYMGIIHGDRSFNLLGRVGNRERLFPSRNFRR